MAQIEVAKALDIENFEQFLREPEVGLDDKKEEEDKIEKQAAIDKAQLGPNSPEAKKEAQIKQPEVPGAKPNANQMGGCGCGQQLTEAHSGEMTIKQWVEDPRLKELAGFTYSDYVISILKVLKVDEFSDLLAITEADLALGLLPSNDINKLKEIFKEGFKKNLTIKQIEKRISENITFKDRLKITEDGKTVLSVAAQNRPNMITRTEASRLANEGLVNHYKDNKIQKVQFLAALSERTCPVCLDLDSSVYLLNESSGIIPVHSNCRCTWLPVVA